MSAYLVHSDTIDYLVTALRVWDVRLQDGRDAKTDPDSIGRILWAENARSVAYRYIEQHEPTDHYRYSSVPWDCVTTIEVLKSIRCLDYQSCETDDWERTVAANILRRLELEAFSHINGYSTAQWGWTRSETQRRRDAIKASTHQFAASYGNPLFCQTCGIEKSEHKAVSR